MKYKAFISYSHRNERWGNRLHRRLETYRFPKKLVGTTTGKGRVPADIKPVFRDREELSAGANLGEEIQKRLRESENLIILCSPEAANSHWVNEEILYFKRYNDPNRIYAFIISGEPYSGGADECFPEALRYELNNDGTLSDRPAEPLAADARDQGDGPRVALLKLLSGMAGLGLDDLIQRDLKRARRRVTWITVSALSAMLVMGSLTWLAMDARQEADARRNDAEGLIEFMLTDLRDKLEPVGRLDALDSVGQKASEYYFDNKKSDADDFGRQARVYHLLSDVYFSIGEIDQAGEYAKKSFEITESQIKSNPVNGDRLFEHMQSIFWVSMIYRQKPEDITKAMNYRKDYLSLAEKLDEIEPESERSTLELGYAHQGIGDLHVDLARQFYNVEQKRSAKQANEAVQKYEQALAYFEDLSDRFPENSAYQIKRLNCLGLLAASHWYSGDLSEMQKLRLQKYELSKTQLNAHPSDYSILQQFAVSQFEMGNTYYQQKKYDTAEQWYEDYQSSVLKLKDRDPRNIDYIKLLQNYQTQKRAVKKAREKLNSQ